ncbi:transposase family protein [Streptomyces shenzhenensis]|uniref:transposase family protein n=1 Tax=Streptomyces shenzhenensis TaxID=943815 RepID=UPI0038022ED9
MRPLDDQGSRSLDGTRRVHLTTADEAARACPCCGVSAVRVKGFVQTRPRDLPHGERKLPPVWRKRRWYLARRLQSRQPAPNLEVS